MSKKMNRKKFLKLCAAGLAGLTVAGFNRMSPGQVDKQEPPGEGVAPSLQTVQSLKSKTEKEFAELGQKDQDSKIPRYLELGKTGIKVSTIGFGVSRTMEPALVLAVIEAGINFMDTGRSYFRGQNEVMVGRTLESRRNDIVFQSKLRINLTGSEAGSRSRMEEVLKQMEASLEASLKALKTEYIDILLIHGAEETAIIHHPEIMRFFEKKKSQGVIRAHGFSTHQNQVELIRAENFLGFYDVIMTTYNHKGAYVHMNSGRKSSWDQEALERELREARERGVGLVAMKTCSGGPYSPSPEVSPSYMEALRWILRRNVVHTMAVAMANHQQIKENLRAWA